MIKNIILYNTPQGNVNVEVVFHNETFWLTQKAMAELFAVAVPAISKHLANIYNTGELRKEATISILETVQKEGSRELEQHSVVSKMETTAANGKIYESDFDKEIKKLKTK